MAKGGLLQKVGQALASVGIKAPWKVRSRTERPGHARPPARAGRSAARGGSSPVCKTPAEQVCLLPLQYTGPVSSPEYLSHLPKAINYRGVPPA